MNKNDQRGYPYPKNRMQSIADEEVRRRIWDAKIPVQIFIDQSELKSFLSVSEAYTVSYTPFYVHYFSLPDGVYLLAVTFCIDHG